MSLILSKEIQFIFEDQEVFEKDLKISCIHFSDFRDLLCLLSKFLNHEYANY